METVDLIASGYDWICPSCDEMNTCQYAAIVRCQHCEREFKTSDDPAHALG